MLFQQIFFAVGANLLMSAMGLTFGTSGFLIPKLENPLTGFGISLEQGSWLGKFTQYAQSIFNKIENIFNKTFEGLKKYHS